MIIEPMTLPLKHVPHRLVVVALAGALLLSACSKEGKTEATQVAAKVGSEEISVHQINQMLARVPAPPNATPDTVKKMGREVLEKLIDQRLVVEEATKAKLHRSPEVVAQIEAARNEILSRAYLQQVTAALPKITADDTRKYYAEHPQLFSERRIFSIQEIVIAPNPEAAEQLRKFAAAGRPAEEVVAWLNSKAIKFQGGNVTKAAEQVALDVLPKLHSLKDGQDIVFETPQAITFWRLVRSEAAPVTEALALPRIEQFLSNQQSRVEIFNTMKRLRESEKIVYMGEFATETKTDAAAGSPAVSPTTKPTGDAATANATPEEKAKATMEKGLQGLK